MYRTQVFQTKFLVNEIEHHVRFALVNRKTWGAEIWRGNDFVRDIGENADLNALIRQVDSAVNDFIRERATREIGGRHA
jgi:hypothetical protein